MFVSSGIKALDLRAMATDGTSGAQGARITEISPYFHPPQPSPSYAAHHYIPPPATAAPYRYQYHQPSPPPAPTVPVPQQQHSYHQGAWYSNSQGYYQPSPPAFAFGSSTYPQPQTHLNESQANSVIYGPPPLPFQTSYPSQYSQPQQQQGGGYSSLYHYQTPSPPTTWGPPAQSNHSPTPPSSTQPVSNSQHFASHPNHQLPQHHSLNPESHLGSLPLPAESPLQRARGSTPSSTDGLSLSMFVGDSASSGSKAPQPGPLPTPASYYTPPPQPNHMGFCQLSVGSPAHTGTSQLPATNPSGSPLLSAVPAHREVSHSGPASALVDEHEKLSQPSSVAVTDKLSFTSPKYKRDDVDVPIGTTPCVAMAGAPPLDAERSSLYTDPTTFEVISHTNTDNEMDVVLLGVSVNADSAQLLMYGLVASYKFDITTSHQSLPHIREVYSRSLRSVGTLISGAVAPLGRPPASLVPIVGCLSPVSLTSAVIVDITETELATHGFSIVNLDWRCDKTVELYVMLQSLWQKDEELKSVVYSSNFGIELIEAEDIHCSAGLFDDQDGMQEEDPIVICGSASEISPEDRNKVNIAATGKNPITAQLTTAWVTSRVITSSVTVSFAHDSLVGIILVDDVSATENVSRAKDVMMLKSKEPRHSYHHTRRVGEGYPGSMWLYSTDMVPFSWSQHLYEEEKVDEDAAYLVNCSYHGNKYFIVMPNPTKWNVSGSLKISAPSANCTKEPSPRISLSSVTSKSLAFESFTCSYLSRNIALMKASDPSTVLKVVTAIIMRKLCVAVLYTPVCSTDILKSISKFYPLRYSSDSLERVVVFMTPMHKPFQYVVKEEFVMTMSTSTFNSPTHALRKLVSLLLVDVHSSPPILDNMLREAEKLILGTLMVRYITELLPLKSLQQGLDIVIHYRLLAFVSSSHLLHCSEGEILGIISIMQHLYDRQSTSYPPESVHLSALIHTWQVTTRDGIDFGAALTTILASVTMHFCSTARHSTIGVIGATLVMFLHLNWWMSFSVLKPLLLRNLRTSFIEGGRNDMNLSQWHFF